MDKENLVKKSYHKPFITSYGKLKDITKQLGPYGSDGMSGSHW